MKKRIIQLLKDHAKTNFGLGVFAWDFSKLAAELENFVHSEVELAKSPIPFPEGFPYGRWIAAKDEGSSKMYVVDGKVTASRLNIRELPTITSSSIGQLQNGNIADIIYTTPNGLWHMIL